MPRHSYRERDRPLRRAVFKLQREHGPDAARSTFPSRLDAAYPADLKTTAPDREAAILKCHQGVCTG